MSTEDLPIVECLTDPEIESTFIEGFTLNDILVLPAKNVIIKDNNRYHLSNKATYLLLILSSSQGEVVSKEVIATYLWGNKYKRHSKISGLISEIRRLLGDRADNPTFIQTIPRKGYKLIVPALPLDENLLSTEVLKAVAQAEQKNKLNLLGDFSYLKNSRLFKIAGTYIVMSWVLMQVVTVSIPVLEIEQWFDKLILLFIIIGFPIVLWYNWYIERNLRKKFINSRNSTATKSHTNRLQYKDALYISVLTICSLVIAGFLTKQMINTTHVNARTKGSITSKQVFNNVIAVLPFTHIGDDSNNPTGDMFHSEIISFLSHSLSIKVVSERVLMGLKSDASLASIKEITGANYILEGRIAEDANTATITTTLTDTSNGHQLWTNRSKVNRTHKLSMVESISRQAYNAIIFLMPQEKNRVMKFRPTNNINAYDFYIRAKSTLKDAYSADELKEAERLFLKALANDNQFELAQAGLCQTYIEQYILLNQSEVFNLAKQACELSININSERADPKIALGRLYLIEGNYKEALSYLEDGLEIDANNSIGLTAKAHALAQLEEYEEANNTFISAIKAEPGYWRNFDEYGTFLFNQGLYAQASLQFHKQSLLQPNSEEAFNNLGAAYYLNNEYEKAIDSWRASAAIKPSANTFSNLGTSMYFARQFDNAVTMYREAVKRVPDDFVLQGNLADAMKYATNTSQESKTTYENALKLAYLADSINSNNASTKASIARFESELGNCDKAKFITQTVVDTGLKDPYIYYELALAINNCGSVEEVLHYLKKTLQLGYPSNLLMSDHQFDKHRDQINEIKKQLKI